MPLIDARRSAVTYRCKHELSENAALINFSHCEAFFCSDERAASKAAKIAEHSAQP
jgi:hypothetical protein